jgi:hypothetical protein
MLKGIMKDRMLVKQATKTCTGTYRALQMMRHSPTEAVRQQGDAAL